MIVVFDPLAQSYEGNGAAVLAPLDCRIRMAAGGEYSFSMDHPIDPWGKWKSLKREAIVRLPVPAERIENSFSGIEADIYKASADTELRDGTTKPSTITYSTWSQYNTYSVGSKVTSQSKNYKCVYWDSNSTYRAERPAVSSWWEEIARSTPGSPVLMNVPAGSELYYVSNAGSGWYKMSTYYGLEGYVESNKLTFYKHTSQSENQPREITEQLFRIREVNIDRTGGKVSVSGVHVSYDLNGVLVEDMEIGQVSPAMAIGRLTEAMLGAYPGKISTDITDTNAGTYTGSWKKKNAMSCLTDPDSGIVPAVKAKFTRDNWDLFVMTDTEVDRGFRIRYGKNADGIQWKVKSDGLVTRIMPVAKAADGSDLYLPEKFVDSSHISEYPVIYMESLSVKGQVGKDDGSGTDTLWTEEALLDEMRAKAEERFTVQKADEPVTEVTVQLEQLEKTAEFAYLRNLMRVNLYDTVHAEDPDVGMSVAVKVTEIEFNAVTEKISGIKLSNIEGSMSRTVAGYSVVNKSIGSEKLKDDVRDEIIGQVVDIIPEYADPTAARPSIITVVDNLVSTSATDALSANQGRVLNDKTTYKAGDTAYMPRVSLGYALTAANMVIYVPAKKLIPSSGLTYTKNFTPSIHKYDGSNVSTTNATYEVSRLNSSFFQIVIKGLSLTIGMVYTILVAESGNITISAAS